MKRNNMLKTLVLSTAAAMLVAAPVSASYGTVNADILTVRTAPSADSEAVAYLNWGDDVCITYVPSESWFEIYLDDGCYYVSSEFVSCGEYGSGTSYSSTESYTTDTDYNYDNGYTETTSAYTEDTYDNGTVSAEESSTSNGTYLGNFTLTAYCSCAACCGGYSNNVTASGTTPVAGRTVAMGGVPFGTKLLINGNVYTVEDRGTSYGVVDIYMNSHSDAIAFGMQSADVYQLD